MKNRFHKPQFSGVLLVVTLLFLGLFCMTIYAIHQDFQGRIGVKVENFFEFLLEGGQDLKSSLDSQLADKMSDP